MDGFLQSGKWAGLGALILVLGVTAMAQENRPILEDVHVRGSAGMTYDRNSTDFMSSSSFGQEFSLDATGALINPNFISFGTNFTYGHFSDSLNSDSLGGGTTIAGSATMLVLPASSYPLTITWQRVRVGLGYIGANTTTNQDRLGFDWRLQLSHLPKFAVRYETDSTSSDVPVGTFSQAESKGSGFSISATDSYKGFDWSAGWQHSHTSSEEVLLQDVLPLDQNYSLLWGNVRKSYLGNRGTFNYNFSRNVTSSDLGTISSIDGVLSVHNASTTIRWTPKLVTSGFFSYYSFDNYGRSVDTSSPNQTVTIVDFPSSGYSASGLAIYQLTKHIAVSDTTGYSTATNEHTVTNNGAPATEQAQTFFTTYPSVSANFVVKRIRVNTSYGVGYMQTITTLGRSFSSLSQNASVTGSWSRPWLTLTGNFGMGNNGIAVMPGAYTNNRNYGITADTNKFRRIGQLRFRWLVNDQEILGGPGWVQSHTNQWAITLMRRRWQVDFGQTGSSGAHQAYQLPTLPFEPVPPLVGVPLLNDTFSNWFLTVSGQVRRNLHLSGTYRKTTNDILLSNGTTHYSLYEITADYRIGKIVMQASYGHYLSLSESPSSFNSSGTNRFRVRIVRTFNLF
ncbi:MAG TPA: hypothetical protein VMS96_00515 [Terriglobales bacterium]|nr:hypothetical protein [Terriglobales bacterium]